MLKQGRHHSTAVAAELRFLGLPVGESGHTYLRCHKQWFKYKLPYKKSIGRLPAFDPN